MQKGYRKIQVNLNSSELVVDFIEDQNEGRRLQKMREIGIGEKFIFLDKQSGKDFDRPYYQLLRKCLDEGDLVYVDALDGLGRDYDGSSQSL